MVESGKGNSSQLRAASKPKLTVLVGDVGGTKTLLALAQLEAERGLHLLPDAMARFPSAAYADLVPLVQAFLRDLPQPYPRWACFGVPGPVLAGHCRTTNLPWELSAEKLALALGLEQVLLLNDVAALAWAFAGSPPALEILREGTRLAEGPVLVVSVGTGLGAATLVPLGASFAVLPSEAGHCDFAGKTQEDIELMAALGESFGHVSYERVVSGPGLAALYRFFARSEGEPPSPEEVLTRTATDPAARQAALALARHLGSFVGNAALLTLPWGGVVLAGSVACALFAAGGQEAFQQAFFAAMEDKGRQRQLLARLPVALLTDPAAPLLGCARALQRCVLAGS